MEKKPIFTPAELGFTLDALRDLGLLGQPRQPRQHRPAPIKIVSGGLPSLGKRR